MFDAVIYFAPKGVSQSVCSHTLFYDFYLI